MDTLLHIGLSNAIAACVLAALAGIVGYFCRRPAVRHALWLLVLLKLVTPPLIDIPVGPPSPPAPVAEAPREEPSVVLVEVEPAEPVADEDGAPVVFPEEPLDVAAAVPAPGVEEPADTTPAPAIPADRSHEPAAVPPWNWKPLLLACWIGGSLLCLALAASRIRCFGRLLRLAQPAPDWLQREVEGLARRLGLTHAPRIGLLPGRLSPMLWAPIWSARLLLPAGLLSRLDAAGRRTLLVHELAHLRRSDHRVRLFELLVTILFWWHPVVWWARRELREAEEQCCDAWVLWALPQSAKTYALTLVETVDYLSETPAPLPALASGVGHVHDLKRRVTMIMQGTTPRALTWRGLLGLVGLGAFLLPVMPSWAQEAPRDAAPVQVTPPPSADLTKAKADLERMLADLKKKEAELMLLQSQVQEAQKRLAAQGPSIPTRETPATREPGQAIIIELVDGNSRQVIKLPAGARVLRGTETRPAPEAVKEHTERTELERRLIELRTAADAAKVNPRGLIIQVVVDGRPQMIELPPGSRVITTEDFRPKVLTRPVSPPAVQPGETKPLMLQYRVVPPAPAHADTEKRLNDLEKRLEDLMRAVKELRGEMHKSKPGTQTGVIDLELKTERFAVPLEVRPSTPKEETPRR